MKRFTQIQVDELNGKITTAEDALRWASENLHPAVAKASSFGAEDSVLIEMMTRVKISILYVGYCPKETHEIMDKCTQISTSGAVSGYKRSRRDGKRKGPKPVL